MIKSGIMNRVITSFSFILLLLACTKETPTPIAIQVPETPKPPLPQGWLVHPDSIKDGGPGKDGIVALEIPNFVEPEDATFLELDELVLGIKIGEDVRAYPHRILDYHELVNDVVNGIPVTITYAPLTGNGLAWRRTIGDGFVTTFGSSGLLYQNNMMPYDRETGSLWSQFRLQCINGKQIGDTLQIIPLVETSWKTWRKFFPQSKILSTQTGFNRNYNANLFENYKKQDDYFLFPIQIAQSNLSNKERVLGVIVNGNVHIYPFSLLKMKPKNYYIYNDEVNKMPLVIAGNYEQNFLVAYGRKMPDGMELFFNPYLNFNTDAIIMRDREGSLWNIFGEAVEGPRKGQRLPQVNAFIGYWFAWSVFYPDAIVE